MLLRKKEIKKREKKKLKGRKEEEKKKNIRRNESLLRSRINPQRIKEILQARKNRAIPYAFLLLHINTIEKNKKRKHRTNK